MHGYKFLALALAKSIYYSHRIERVGEFERAKYDVKMCKATLFEMSWERLKQLTIRLIIPLKVISNSNETS